MHRRVSQCRAQGPSPPQTLTSPDALRTRTRHVSHLPVRPHSNEPKRRQKPGVRILFDPNLPPPGAKVGANRPVTGWTGPDSLDSRPDYPLLTGYEIFMRDGDVAIAVVRADTSIIYCCGVGVHPRGRRGTRAMRHLSGCSQPSATAPTVGQLRP